MLDKRIRRSSPPKRQRNTTPKTKSNAGRPTKYKPEYAEQAYKICLLSVTDKDLADFFEVSEATLNNWKLNHPKFIESIKEGKRYADANVAKRLYNRAMGYSVEETKVFVYQGDTITKTITKNYPPDTTACIFWLKNRQPEMWRDKKEPGQVAKESEQEAIAQKTAEAIQEMTKTLPIDFDNVIHGHFGEQKKQGNQD